jgi:DNA mismatch endonuclease (patch repair protein)
MDVFGRPDFVFTKDRLAVFVDGCFWHGCPRCFQMPRQNRHFWRTKIKRNRIRDRLVTRTLKERGWKVLRTWECVLQRRPASAVGRIRKVLDEAV